MAVTLDTRQAEFARSFEALLGRKQELSAEVGDVVSAIIAG